VSHLLGFDASEAARGNNEGKKELAKKIPYPCQLEREAQPAREKRAQPKEAAREEKKKRAGRDPKVAAEKRWSRGGDAVHGWEKRPSKGGGAEGVVTKNQHSDVLGGLQMKEKRKPKKPWERKKRLEKEARRKEGGRIFAGIEVERKRKQWRVVR